MSEEVPVYEARMYSDGVYLKVPKTKEGLELAKFLLNHFEKEFKNRFLSKPQSGKGDGKQ